MSKPEVLEKMPMNTAEVKAALEKIKKGLSEDEQLNFRAQKTDEYVQDVTHLKPKQAQELYEKLMGLDIPRFKDAHAHKLIDLLPSSERQVKLILSAYHLTLSAEAAKKVAQTIAEFTAK